jgi:hypothetical protein
VIWPFSTKRTRLSNWTCISRSFGKTGQQAKSNVVLNSLITISSCISRLFKCDLFHS